MMLDERLKSLPVPTLEQTARFADHVANNHSWYKHLPFFPPGASFIVFPNPNAGRGVKADGERFAVYDIEKGDYFSHHSRLPTAMYIAQFGHWDYWYGDNPRSLVPLIDEPWLYLIDGNRECLADDLKQLGSRCLTAFLRPVPHMFSLQEKHLKREADAFLASTPSHIARLMGAVFGWRQRASTTDPDVERYRRVARKMRQSAGLRDCPRLDGFMASEAAAQRGILIDTLHRVRAVWSESSAQTTNDPT